MSFFSPCTYVFPPRLPFEHIEDSIYYVLSAFYQRKKVTLKIYTDLDSRFKNFGSSTGYWVYLV